MNKLESNMSNMPTGIPKDSLAKEKSVFEETEVDGEKIICRRLDNMLEEYADALANADSYQKRVIVSARQATEREEIITSQDGMKNYADPGDWIIHNPGDKDPYVFGNKEDPVEARQQKFAGKYEAIEGQPGQFRAKGIVKAVQVNENIVFRTSWGEQMVVRAGGWVTDGGYGIAKDSFANTFEKIEQGWKH
jgi:hypothetical protein